jgi:hypothetical protein
MCPCPLLAPQPEDLAADLPPIVKVRGAEICLKCRFSRLLCGRPACPILLKLSSYSSISPKLGLEMRGDSPPSVFVGRFGYPKVSFGPLLPPVSGDTSVYDEPESWRKLGFREIVDLRMSMVRGRSRIEVDAARDPSGLLYDLQTALLSSRPVPTDLAFSKPPRGPGFIDETSPPFGPSASLQRYNFFPQSSDRRLEKVYYDSDLKASPATVQLYESGVSVTGIQRLFSLGMIGTKRRLVPTRWSITAVDDIISRELLERVKMMQSIDLCRVFVHDMLGSRYVLIFSPGNFGYEWVEAWFPRTLWNPAGRTAFSVSDHEGFRGRSTYAAPGGCYYSVRLAVAEYLYRLGRQATVIALREIYPGQLLPLGVWNVREAIRSALETQPAIFDTFEEAASYALSKLTLGLHFWKERSSLLRGLLTQKKLAEFS